MTEGTPGVGRHDAMGKLLWGRSPAMKRVLEQCQLFAPGDDPVLILGERGTGKTMLARYLHDLSRRSGSFVRCSVPGIPASLLENELFGHARGAYTGAVADRPGLLEEARGGTVLLDEFGLAAPALQAVLLHVLDGGRIRRIGEYRDRPLDVRILAATNEDMAQLAETGAFRPDLLDRVGFFWIELPPLRERPDEILPLMDHYLTREAHQRGRATPSYDAMLRTCFLAAPWGGNLREVAQLAAYIVATALDGEARMEHLPLRFLATLPPGVQAALNLPLAERVERALAANQGNKTRAAQSLGLSRRHLYRLMEKLQASR